MALTPITTGEQLIITPKDGITIDGVSVSDYTVYDWYCTVKQSLSDTTGINGTIDSINNPDRFNVDATTLKIKALDEAESLSLDGPATTSKVGNQPVITTLYVDVWAVDVSGNDIKMIFDTVKILKSVTETRD